MRSSRPPRPKPNGCATIKQKAMHNQRVPEECTPGYYNNEGKPRKLGAFRRAYGGGPVEFHDIMRKWREDGEMKGLKLT